MKIKYRMIREKKIFYFLEFSCYKGSSNAIVFCMKNFKQQIEKLKKAISLLKWILQKLEKKYEDA